MIIFFISNYSYEVGSIFYNSLLKKCSNENNIGKISGFGFALGYIGSVPIILLTLYLFVLPETVPFGLDKNNFEHIRFIPIIVALWFFFFSFMFFNRRSVVKLTGSTLFLCTFSLCFRLKVVCEVGGPL